MNAAIEIFWDDSVSRYDNLPYSFAVSSARIAALSGGHAIVTLSGGDAFEFISDDTLDAGYRMERVIG